MLEQGRQSSFCGSLKLHWVFQAEADANHDHTETMTASLRGVKKLIVLLSGLQRDDAR